MRTKRKKKLFLDSGLGFLQARIGWGASVGCGANVGCGFLDGLYGFLCCLHFYNKLFKSIFHFTMVRGNGLSSLYRLAETVAKKHLYVYISILLLYFHRLKLIFFVIYLLCIELYIILLFILTLVCLHFYYQIPIVLKLY